MSNNKPLSERDKISDEAFRVLLDLYMVSDPWPLEDKDNVVMFGFLSAESQKRGYKGWVEAYHEFEVDDD